MTTTEKDLIKLFPGIFNPENELIKKWHFHEKKLEEMKENYFNAEKNLREYFKSKILSQVTDPGFKKILLQPVVLSEGVEPNDVIGALIQSYMRYNKSTHYSKGIIRTQTHRMKTFPGSEDFFGKRFQLKELNAQIWCRQYPGSEESLILNVDQD